MTKVNNEFIDHLLFLMSLGEFKPRTGTYFYQRKNVIMCTYSKPTRKYAATDYCIFIPTDAVFSVLKIKKYYGDPSSILFFNGVSFKDVSAKYARGTVCH